MISRARMKSRAIQGAFSSPSSGSRMIVSLTFVPGAPRKRLRTSVTSMSFALSPSTWAIRSLGRTPAIYAGVPGMGVSTVSQSSLTLTRMPTPPNSPSVSVLISRIASWSRYWEKGSRVLTMPEAAPAMSFWASGSST